ncbi:MAG: S-layer homology domain-containing protein [Anaerotignum sp.]|nr:S-layer homology domain-containing protein [Anaerotignum sp.]
MKRFAAILLAGILSVSAALPAFAAIETNAAKWALSSMEYAYEHGFVTEEELQKATSPMSRKEFCGVVMGFLESVTGIERKATIATPFSDCDDPMVIAAYEAGVIGGVEPGVFAPDRTLTREQMAIMIARTLKVCNLDLAEDAKKNPFTDTSRLYDSSNNYIDQLYGAEIVNGYEDGTYGPFREMTIQEAVISFVRAHRYIMTGMAYDPNAVVEEETKTTEEKEDKSETETVEVDGKPVMLRWTAEELKAVWGEPDRIDTSVYGLDRYIYLNDYQDYFFVTFEDGEIVEIFVPGTDYTYMGMNGKGTMADIKNLTFVSMAEHSGVVRNEGSEARLPMDYEGNLCGLLLQTDDFAANKDPMSTLHHATREDMEMQLLDLIQVCRVERNGEQLIWDKKLWDVARAHSEDMIAETYFDYNSLDGTTPFGRIMERGKEFFTASEIIARNRGDIVNVYQEWMRTPARVSALTDSTMQEVGIGIASRTKVLHVTVDLCGQAPEINKK